MAVTFTSTMPGASADYVRYLYERPTKTDRHGDSVLFDFVLVPVDSAFVKLKRGSYIVVDSAKYPKWFTGYIVNEPELTYLGEGPGKTAVYGYKYEATADEYLLSLKPIGIIPPFLNVSMGYVLRTLADRMAPGVFDLSNIEDGPLLAEYTVDPTKKFLDVSKEFCDGASFQFFGNDHKLYYRPQDAVAPGIVIDATDKDFTPSRLQLRPAASPVINDAIVLGDTEPQTYMHEYFVGTGLQGSFPLVAGVFGADTSVLLDEQFTSSAIDASLWTVYDKPQNYLQVDSGYLNVLGGSGDASYDVSLQSAYALPMDGRLRLTHGEWDFISGTGVICGCWTQQPNALYTGCLYALKVSGMTLHPIVNESVDTTQSVPLSTDKRYVIRTLVEFSKLHRASQTYNYLNQAGEVTSITRTVEPDTVTWQTIVTEVNPSNGSVTNQWSMVNTGSVLGTEAYAAYIPVASDDLHATFTGITLSVPLAATLSTADIVQFNNLSFSYWDDTTHPTGWENPVNVFEETPFANDTNACKMQADGINTPSIEQSAASLIKANTKYSVFVMLRRTIPTTTGTFKIFLQGTGITPTGLSVSHAFLSSGDYYSFTGTLTEPLATIPGDLKLVIQYAGAAATDAIWVDSIVILSEWQNQLIGPNEMDAMDGMAPIATIVSPNTGATTKNTYLGTTQYNPGQCQLVFFKDSVTLTSDVPPQNQLIRLSYRAAGAAIGRAINRASFATESAGWGDDGVRSVVRSDLVPRPRNSVECEMAASAIVAENSFPHYEGSYEQFSDYFTTEPRSGAILKFLNLTQAVGLQAEEINEVVTSLESKSPVEHFYHQITFGKPDRVRQLLSSFDSTKGAFQPTANQSTPNAVDLGTVGLTFAPDVTFPVLLGWDASKMYFDAGQDLIPDGLRFEVRYTDEGWGVDDGKNLVLSTGPRQFTVPRTSRGRVFFIKQVNVKNVLPWSEDQTKTSVYTLSNATATRKTALNPDGNYSQVTTVALGSGSSSITATFPLAPAYTHHCFSFSVKGPAGKVLTASFAGQTSTVTLNGFWQRFSVPFSGVPSGGDYTASLSYASSPGISVQTTRWSVEQNSIAETAYNKTNASTYGPVSRYAACVHVAFPAADVLTGDNIDLTTLRIKPTY